MIIAIDSGFRRSVLAEQDVSRFADEFFNHWPARRPASELEVLMLSRALECGESVLERHLSPGAPNNDDRKVPGRCADPEARRPVPPGWQCINGTRAHQNAAYHPQLEKLLHSSRCLRLASGREMERSAAVSARLDRLVLQSTILISTSRAQILRAEALFRKARFVAGQ